MHPDPIRFCNQCKARLVRNLYPSGEWESPASLVRRKFCNRECRLAHWATGVPGRAKPTPKRYCFTCGARMYRKRYNGTLEDMGAFIRRKYCDRACMAKGLTQDSVSHGTHHWRARKYKKQTCEECGTAERLHVHHVDGNWQNNDPPNLRTLCGPCHGRHHWAHDDRRGERRKKRLVSAEALDQLYGWAEHVDPSLTRADADELRTIVERLRGALRS